MRRTIILATSLALGVVLSFGCSGGGGGGENELVEQNKTEVNDETGIPLPKQQNIAEGNYCFSTDECSEGLVCLINVCQKPVEPEPPPPPPPPEETSPVVEAQCPEATVTKENSGNISFSADKEALFYCKLDNSTPDLCEPPFAYSNLADGPHNFSVYAVGANQKTSEAVSCSWAVDTTKPAVVSTDPAAGAKVPVTTNVFGIYFSEPIAKVGNVKISSGNDEIATTGILSAGNTSYFLRGEGAKLPNGRWTISVNGFEDPAGNVMNDFFSVFAVDDIIPPNPTPPVLTTNCPIPELATVNAGSISFSTDKFSIFYCKIDNAAETLCTSPYKYQSLNEGEHTFTVYAVSQDNLKSGPGSCALNVETISNLVDLSCPVGGIKYLSKPEDLYASVPQELLAPKPAIEGIDNKCSEDVNLKPRPDFNNSKDLNYLSEWFYKEPDDGKEHAPEFNDFPHLVTGWNYSLLPFTGSIKPDDVYGMALKFITEDGKTSSAGVTPCAGNWNVKFAKKFKNAKMDVYITTKDGATQVISYGPFTVGNAWYVRATAAKPYGYGDGTSYANGFSGLVDLSAKFDKVLPGDTVFITGLQVHDYQMDKGLTGTAYNIFKSGLSESEQIIYRGDYPKDKGIVWGATRFAGWKWAQVDNGIYRFESVKIDSTAALNYFFEKVGFGGKLNHRVLAQAKTKEGLKNYAGSYYLEENVKDAANGKTYTLYVHLSDNKAPGDGLYFSHAGYQFFFNSDIYHKNPQIHKFQYATFKNLVLFGQTYPPGNTRFSHVRWENCKIAYGTGFSPLTFWYDTDHIDVVDSEMSCFGNGIYSMNQETTMPANDTLKFYAYKRLYIHDIGIRGINANMDSHPIGLQGPNFGVIEDGLFVNCGSGPVLWTRFTQDAKDNTFRRNFVKIGHSMHPAEGLMKSAASGQCFTMVTDASYESGAEGNKVGNVIEDNIGEGCQDGFGVNFRKFDNARDEGVIIQNNVVLDALYGITVGDRKAKDGSNNGAHIVFENNVQRLRSGAQAHFTNKSAPPDTIIEMDNNIYNSLAIPFSQTLFYFPNKFYENPNMGLTFKQWQTLKCAGCSFDPNSKISTDKEIFERLLKKYNELGVPEEFRRKVE